MMLSLREAALAVSGQLLGNGDIAFSRVTTDSRDIRPGDLFVALRGENFDGHAFAAQALAQGAVAVLSESTGAGVRIIVTDTLAALGQLGQYWRNKQTDLTVVAITGSNGKTTVKEMTATVLAAQVGADAVVATRGNLNNHIGVPLTLLSIRPEHRYAVVELGMNHFGEIDYLTRLVRPDVALVNNAGSAHLESLGSVEGVARAKGEIFAGLKPGGVAIINADDEFASLWGQIANGYKQITFGLRTAEVAGHAIELGGVDTRFVLTTPLGGVHTRLGVPGKHNVSNATAAAAIGYALGFEVRDIAAALESYTGVKGRLQTKTAFNGATLIDDTYNANPDSMKAAVDVLVNCGGNTVLVLGDIGEIGSDGPALHREIGVYAKEKGVGALYTLGEQMKLAAEAFDGEPPRGQHFAGVEALVAALRPNLSADSTVLVKGSRFMRMERVVEALASGQPQGEA